MSNYINEELIKQVSHSLNITDKQVNDVLGLLKEGNTVPFIARYRKEVTGALDEEQIRAISKEYEYGENLNNRKEDVIRLIDEKGLLTEELKNKIISCTKLIEVEDLYRPFKEKKKTKATEAIKNGLEPLAKIMMSFPTVGSLEEIASKYINESIKTTEEAVAGAKYIIAEWISDNAYYRKWVRNETYRLGVISSKLKKKAVDEKKVYEMYYDYNEPVKSIRLHRVLAINRAEKEKVLSVSISIDKDTIINFLESKVVKNKGSFVYGNVLDAINDSYKRLIKPSIEREIRSELTERAENNAIHIFSENLRSLLLQPPMKGKMVLGVDPAYRTGCKLAVVNQTGKVENIDVIYPHQKYPGENIREDRIKKAMDITKKIIKDYSIEIIAIGNGTASRETEQFILDVIKTLNNEVYYIIVNEAGASVYSASDLARNEFPDYKVEERSAVSIARRLQDPLSELVKIDPKSIGVGQYQHDVTQSKLSDSLDFIVETAVNQVGVNVNTASQALLQYVSGLNKTVANNIVKYRNEVGVFKDRKDIKSVQRLGNKGYQQAIGFLRIVDGLNPLDKTGIHPESYKDAEKLLNFLEIDKYELGNTLVKEKIELIDREELIKLVDVGEHTLNDILDAFIAPTRDPRDDLDKPLLRSDVLKLDDLKPGMELQGTVRNVVDFGAFVDCGVKEDGLVHISKMSKAYIKHPLDVISVGDIIKVWVLDVDIKRGRLQLTMINDL